MLYLYIHQLDQSHITCRPFLHDSYWNLPDSFWLIMAHLRSTQILRICFNVWLVVSSWKRPEMCLLFLLGFCFNVNIYWSLKWWLPTSTTVLGLLSFPPEALQSDLQSQQGLLETLQAPQDFKNILYCVVIVLSEWIISHLLFSIVFYEHSMDCPVLARESISCAVTTSIPCESTNHSPHRQENQKAVQVQQDTIESMNLKVRWVAVKPCGARHGHVVPGGGCKWPDQANDEVWGAIGGDVWSWWCMD